MGVQAILALVVLAICLSKDFAFKNGEDILQPVDSRLDKVNNDQLETNEVEAKDIAVDLRFIDFSCCRAAGNQSVSGAAGNQSVSGAAGNQSVSGAAGNQSVSE
ncbi:hypothetical protein OJAV_G00159580 [Oryzias javanicus]|uniref:Uncharacterized protein n=1 Tax=Oryzias javanicus TaxID=123683 RepID=A0A3S2M9F9_ORYJA|nr:hypothetical protein OJAV_G00159580 [Oryzias javanicus]